MSFFGQRQFLSPWLLHFSIFLLGISFLSDSIAFAKDVNQADAQRRAENLNHGGSDDSIDSAVSNGTTALMNLAALNIPGAFTFGYKAYDNYLNSEEFDDLESRTSKNKNVMSSIASNAVSHADTKAVAVKNNSSGISGETRNSIFDRLDASMMYKGQTAVVAEEFERRTGMKRDLLFAEAVDIYQSGYSFDDPQILDKLHARFKSFTAKIPNKEFREGLERVQNMVPRPMQDQILARLQERYAKSDPKPSSGIAEAIFAGPQNAPAAATTDSAAPKGAVAKPVDVASLEVERSPASETVEVEKKMEKIADAGLFIGLGKIANVSLNTFVRANNEMPPDNESIFSRVSARYRVLAPSMQMYGSKAAN